MIKEIFYQSFPSFSLNDNFILRELMDSDAKDYFLYMNNPALAEFLTGDTRPQSLTEALTEIRYWSSLFRSRRSFYWGIAATPANQLIGTIGFNSINFYHLRAEISYDLDYQFWGKSIMAGALQKVLDFAELIGLVRVQATVMASNKRSIKLLEKCGFVKEGLLKKYEIVGDKHHDYYLYAKTT